MPQKFKLALTGYWGTFGCFGHFSVHGNSLADRVEIRKELKYNFNIGSIRQIRVVRKNIMEIKRIAYEFSVCKVTDYSLIRLDSEYCFIGKTDEEKSLVCISTDVPPNVTKRDDGWRAFRIQEELDFSLIGILSDISGILAENKIGIFAISTFNTDYVLTKKENYEKALDVLSNTGYEILE